jgi:hypothetical protein
MHCFAFYFQKSFIAFSCILIAVTAAPQWAQRQVYSGAPGPYSPYGAVSPYGNVAAVLSPPIALSPENSAQLKGLARAGAPQLVKATDMLQLLMKGLPAALQNMDPALKADFAKVNNVITDVCSKILTQAQPTVYSSYNPQDLKTTCDYINKVSSDVTAGLDNPAIVQSYVDQLKIATNALIAEA